jgi:hypothetical protein
LFIVVARSTPVCLGEEEVVDGERVVRLDRRHLGDAKTGLRQRALRRRRRCLGHVGQRRARQAEAVQAHGDLRVGGKFPGALAAW